MRVGAMTEQSRDCYERRAEEEKLATKKAAEERAAESHRELAERYQRAAAGEKKPEMRQLEPLSEARARSAFRIAP